MGLVGLEQVNFIPALTIIHISSQWEDFGVCNTVEISMVNRPVEPKNLAKCFHIC